MFLDQLNLTDFRITKNRAYPIGAEPARDVLKLVQVGRDERGMSLIGCESRKRPADVEPDSGGWQRWAVEALREMTANGKFHGREVVATIPANDVFVDHISMPQSAGKGGNRESLQETVLSRIKHRLTFESDDIVLRFIPTLGDNGMVIAIEREKIDRHLAIYERANLQIKSIGIWPTAMSKSYFSLFCGGGGNGVGEAVMLVGIDEDATNVVVCRDGKALFARSISIGAGQFEDEGMVTRLVLELAACRGKFEFLYSKMPIERLVFFSGCREGETYRATCAAIAGQLEIAAQIGDCLAAVTRADANVELPPDCDYEFNWSTVLGLSLS